MRRKCAFGPDSVVEIDPMYVLRWEECQKGYVLLYPEGVVKLNTTAAAILKLCDGRRSVSEIAAMLEDQYTGESIASGIGDFLRAYCAKGWIRAKSSR